MRSCCWGKTNSEAGPPQQEGREATASKPATASASASKPACPKLLIGPFAFAFARQGKPTTLACLSFINFPSEDGRSLSGLGERRAEWWPGSLGGWVDDE